MITREEILHNYNSALPLDTEIENNLTNVLLPALNKFRAVYGKPMIVTSGLRSKESHIAIYNRKGIYDIDRIPMGSAHLQGLATDFRDHKGLLKNYCLNNISLLEECGLYMEDPVYTLTWCHLQAVAPRSGKRIFIP